jgi:DNA-binding response OmpR family regulator
MTDTKILIVDDDANTSALLKMYFENEGYDVKLACDGVEGLSYFKMFEPDLVLLDIVMPKKDGWQVCREIRKTSNTPIIMLSARGEEYDKINGFELGIDDYVVKPFSPKELMLRIEAIMKRVHRQGKVEDPSNRPHDVIELDGGGLRVDITARIVYVQGERVEMSPKEYDLFFYMLENRNIALSREKLISEVWGYDFYGDVRTLDTHVKLLRKSLGDYSSYIVTLRGVGYRFESKE